MFRLRKHRELRQHRGLWLWGVVALLLLALAGIVAWLYRTIPLANTAQTHFDALLVLGSPAGLLGEPMDEQRWRVDEALREFRAGRAPIVLFSGGPVANRFVEADVMAGYAQANGLPPAAVLEERRARNTIENLALSEQLLKAHGLQSVEVISSADHLHRAALLLAPSRLAWRTHAAPTPGRGPFDQVLYTVEEALTTALLRCFGVRIMPVLHGFAAVQHAIGWGFRWILYFLTGRLGRMQPP